jgi:(E)-2-((N-methylformamido)methylene)succinate hydrolase
MSAERSPGPMVEGAGGAVALATREAGEGPAILLLHGIGGNRTVWNTVIPLLASDFRVIAPDLRGHGRTVAPPGSTFSFEEMLGDVVKVLDDRGLDSAHWVGLSGGALLALRAALDARPRCRSLTMVSGAAYTDSHTRAIAQRWAETYAKEGPDPFALRLLKDLYYPDWIEDHLDFADELRKDVKEHDYRPAVRWAEGMARFDERNRIASISVPTLIVQAMDDAIVDASHGRILRQTIPGAQIRIFPQTGHMIPVERPRELAEAIAAHVRAAEARPSEPTASSRPRGV